MDLILLDPEQLHILYECFPKVLEHMNELDPIIFRTNDGICCSSGSNQVEQIYGYGETVEMAIQQWENNYLWKMCMPNV